MTDQAVQDWLEEIGTPPTGRVVIHAELPVSAGEQVLDDDKGKEIGRLDELVESDRPVILHISGYVQVIRTQRTEDGAPVLYVEPHEGGSFAVNEILAR